ncbi:S1C family serine protease [Candidatus Methylacidithermus pantelleriae]|nr:S1C family serine protease [Candidatus Methylacidithermus pantelleriae]
MIPPSPFRVVGRLVVFLLGGCLLTCHDLVGQGLFESIEREVNRIFLTAREGVARVWARQGELTTVGTGFFVAHDGSLLTAWGVVGSSREVAVEIDGRRYAAQVVGGDRRSGVALVRAAAPQSRYKILAMGDSRCLQPGSPVVAVGYPLNLPAAPSFGLVAGMDTQFLNQFFPTTHLRTDVSVSPGQIGSPLLNDHCEVVGMVVMVADNRRITYALPSQALERIRDDLVSYGRVRYGWVGVEVEEAPGEMVEGKFARISRLIPGTPAASSGLQAGDILYELQGKPIHYPRDVVDPAFYARVGQRLSVAVLRGETLLRFSLPVVERPIASENGLLVAPSKERASEEVRNVNVSRP